MKRKITCLLRSLVPFLLLMIIQSLVLYAVTYLDEIISQAGSKASLLTYENTTLLTGVIGYGIFLIPGIYWYQNLCKWEPEKKIKKISLLTLIAAGLCLQLCVDTALFMLNVSVPEIMESYIKVMDNLGMSAPTLLSVLYVVIMSPIAEELLLRGLCLKTLETEFPFWQANILQALCFGIFHMNLIQGTYAFLAGILFGYLTKRYGTLKASILCHFTVNLSGQVIGLLTPKPGYEAIAFLLIAVLLAVFLKKEKQPTQ